MATSPVQRYSGPFVKEQAWQYALWERCQHPEKFPKEIIKVTDRLMSMNDGFPKSKRHALIMPREKIESIYQLRREHLPLLDEMEKWAEDMIEDWQSQDTVKTKYLYGFHAIPSMRQMHLHVIANDLTKVKNRHHYLSYTTPFFISMKLVKQHLQSFGFVQIDEKEMLEYVENPKAFECHKCHEVIKGTQGPGTTKGVAALKLHLEKCNL